MRGEERGEKSEQANEQKLQIGLEEMQVSCGCASAFSPPFLLCLSQVGPAISCASVTPDY